MTPSFVARLEQKKGVLGRKLKVLKDDVDRPLAAILSLNTIAHTVGAAGAGAQATHVFGDAYVGVISGVLTLLILVFSEIIPKTLGAVYWRRLAPVVVRILGPVMWMMWPLVKVSNELTLILSRNKVRISVSREEFHALAELGEQEGVLNEDETRILKNLIRFRSVLARDIMTPRTVIFALKADSTVNQIMLDNREIIMSRIPIYGESLDDIHGFVLKSDILIKAVEHEDVPLRSMLRELRVVSETLNLQKLFEQMMKWRVQIVLAVDEYGGTQGLVTMEDLMETLIGLEIIDEADPVHDMQILARKQWKKRARRMGLISDADPEPDNPK